MKRGQAVVEYMVILGIVALALAMMQVYVRRGIQAGIKIAADEIGLQEDSIDAQLGLDPAKEKEISPTKIVRQEIKVRNISSSAHDTTYGENGARTVTINEDNEVDTAESRSKYWSNWKED